MENSTDSTASLKKSKGSAIILEPHIGGLVLTTFGMGTVAQVLTHNHQVQVILSSWKLAQESQQHVVCYLRVADITIVSQQALDDMTMTQQIAFTKLLKDLACTAQNKKQTGLALSLHQTLLRACTTLLKTCHSPARADILVHAIKCNNHAAACALQLELRRVAREHAKTAIAIMDALQTKKTSATSASSTTSITSTTSLGEIKLFGQFRVKSLILVARSYLDLDGPTSTNYLKPRHRDAAKLALDKADALVQATIHAAAQQDTLTKGSSTTQAQEDLRKQLASYRRQVKKLKQQYKQLQQQPPPLRSTASSSASYGTASRTSKRMVSFADEKRASARPTTSSWGERVVSYASVTGFLVLGGFMLHQFVSGLEK
jgi:hypothetical protein